MEYKKDDILTIDIIDITQDGEGIGKKDGYALFVKDAVIGDTVKAKIMKAKKNYAYAHLEQIVAPSSDRVEPGCKVSRQCGGCQLQAISYERQLSFKQEKVKGNLIRLGGFEESLIEKIMEPICGMEEPYRYRNKAQYPIGYDKNGGLIAGFYASRTHAIIPNADCLLGPRENEKILEVILNWMQDNQISAYDEKQATGLVRHVLLRKGFHTGQIMICLVINDDRLAYQQELVAALSALEGVTSISYSINKSHTNVIMGDNYHTIYGDDTIEDYIGNLRFEISPLSFYQVNPMQTNRMYTKALEYAALTGTESVWDLYCGIGTISLFMASQARRIYGVEIIPQAIDNARANAQANGISNATFFVGKAEEVLPDFYARSDDDSMKHPDVIVVDPPRKGCDEACLETMLKMKPSRIIYVSCDSATLARDLKMLCEKDYELKAIQAFDNFPQTTHAETVCLLSKLHEVKHHVSVTVDMDEMDLTSAESKATYEEIKQYVANHNEGMKVSNLYIAQVKAKHGIIERENYNLPRSKNSRQPGCPEEKVKAIEDAMRHFKMI